MCSRTPRRAAYSGHSARLRRPRSSSASSPCHTSADGLSIPAAAYDAPRAGSGSTTSTRCPRRTSSSAQDKPDDPGPENPDPHQATASASSLRCGDRIWLSPDRADHGDAVRRRRPEPPAPWPRRCLRSRSSGRIPLAARTASMPSGAGRPRLARRGEDRPEARVVGPVSRGPLGPGRGPDRWHRRGGRERGGAPRRPTGRRGRGGRRRRRTPARRRRGR